MDNLKDFILFYREARKDNWPSPLPETSRRYCLGIAWELISIRWQKHLPLS